MNKLETIIAVITIATISGCLGINHGYRGQRRRDYARNYADVNSGSTASIATATTSTIAPVNTISGAKQLPDYEQNQQTPQYFDWEEVDGQYKF